MLFWDVAELSEEELYTEEDIRLFRENLMRRLQLEWSLEETKRGIASNWLALLQLCVCVRFYFRFEILCSISLRLLTTWV